MANANPVQVVIGEPAVGRYLDAHGVLSYLPIEAVLAREVDPATGVACVMFSCTLPDGQRVLTKIPLATLMHALRLAAR